MLRIRHYGAGLSPMKMGGEELQEYGLVGGGEREAVFEDPKRQFPRRIVYARPKDDELVARLEDAAGKPKMEFRFAPVR